MYSYEPNEEINKSLENHLLKNHQKTENLKNLKNIIFNCNFSKISTKLKFKNLIQKYQKQLKFFFQNKKTIKEISKIALRINQLLN